MQIIPVLDLKDGVVVHARAGQRQQYRPIQSVLCDSPQPELVIQGFLKLFPFRTMYVADLDMLTGEGDQTAVLCRLLERFIGIQFWIDQGCLRDQDQYPPNWTPVIGTESIDQELYDTNKLPANSILSLDFNDAIIGNTQIANTPRHWPEHVIVMTLNRVGTNDGPDWERLKAVLKQSIHSHITAAGGIRNADDLIKLSQHGIKNTLAATALHCGHISTEDIHQLSRY